MPAADQQPPHFRTIAMIVGTAMFMEGLDGTILATGLPSMSRDLGVPATVMSISLTSYLISLAIFIPASGRIADRYGARNIFRAAILLFTAGSIFCAQAPDLTLLVLARFLQGIGGAMMVPVGRLVLIRTVEKRHMIAAMSWVLVPALVGPILGPPVGGFIVTYFNWRWIFYINIPIGLLGIALATIFLPDTDGETAQPFDLMGMALSGLCLGPLLFGFEMASHPGAFGFALGLLAFGTAAGMVYLAHAKRTPEPILDPRLMQVPTFRISMIAGSLTRITQGAHPFLLPLMLQLGFGFTALQSGLMTLATALGSFFMKAVAPRVLRRYGFRDSLVVNGIVSTAGYALCAAFRPGWPVSVMFAILLGCGFFMSFQFTAYNTIAFDEVPPDRASAATSFYATFQQLMLSMGVCAGAAGLAAAMALDGHAAPNMADFSGAFLMVTVISAFATIWNARFAADAGTELSGHTPRTGSVRQIIKGTRSEIPL
jgi:EmrB/QacA subfamily drug resistance transporter